MPSRMGNVRRFSPVKNNAWEKATYFWRKFSKILGFEGKFGLLSPDGPHGIMPPGPAMATSDAGLAKGRPTQLPELFGVNGGVGFPGTGLCWNGTEKQNKSVSLLEDGSKYRSKTYLYLFSQSLATSKEHLSSLLGTVLRYYPCPFLDTSLDWTFGYCTYQSLPSSCQASENEHKFVICFNHQSMYLLHTCPPPPCI